MPRSRRPQDAFGARAKEAGYAARSVYKLEEIDKRARLLGPGMRVLDLGAAPGSWLQYVAARVGPRGRVLGVDQQALDIGLAPQASYLQADVFEVTPAELGGEASFDVVVSDLAPRTSGQRHRDQYRSYELFRRALELAEQVLAPGGHFVGKLFQGAELDEARQAARERFGRVRIMKPRASRKESIELFVVALEHRTG